MSYSLVRASLDLVEFETDVNPDKKKKKKKRQNGVLNLIPAHQRLPQKGKITRSSRLNSQSQQKSLRNTKKSIQDNVQRLLSLSSRKLDGETAEKLFNRAVKQPVRRNRKPQEQQTTAFTEEDFAKFAAEYRDE
ncbi:uncharacterized protein [Fopius arisanus]|uniref:40S ribosomal protein S19-binding protein 1 n=1 Tax=Fopius arisanus TaxID=64838 RepID=A0A9R1TM69_9HYME|nr:PREDICTED: uncharacterized protein LOC105271481 [Fopius arisanus]